MLVATTFPGTARTFIRCFRRKEPRRRVANQDRNIEFTLFLQDVRLGQWVRLEELVGEIYRASRARMRSVGIILNPPTTEGVFAVDDQPLWFSTGQPKCCYLLYRGQAADPFFHPLSASLGVIWRVMSCNGENFVPSKILPFSAFFEDAAHM